MTDCPPTNEEKNNSQRLFVQAARYDLQLHIKIVMYKKTNYLFWIPAADVQTMQDISNETQLQNSCLSSEEFWQVTLQEVSVRYLHLPVGALVI